MIKAVNILHDWSITSYVMYLISISFYLRGTFVLHVLFLRKRNKNVFRFSINFIVLHLVRRMLRDENKVFLLDFVGAL